MSLRATGSQEAINFVSSLIHVSFALFLISFMEESASHPTSAFPEAECPKLYVLEVLYYPPLFFKRCHF